MKKGILFVENSEFSPNPIIRNLIAQIHEQDESYAISLLNETQLSLRHFTGYFRCRGICYDELATNLETNPTVGTQLHLDLGICGRKTSSAMVYSGWERARIKPSDHV